MGNIRRLASGALMGLVAAGVAVGVGELVAAFTGPETAPVFAVGESAIDLTPTPLKEFAVRDFGTHDKLVLLSGIYATLAVVAVAAGILALRWRGAGLAVVGVFGAVGAWAAASRPAADGGAVWPSVVAGVAGMAALWTMARAWERDFGEGDAVAASPAADVGEAPDTTDVTDAVDFADVEDAAPRVGSGTKPAQAVEHTADSGPAADTGPVVDAEPTPVLAVPKRRSFLAVTAGTAAAAALAGFGGEALVSRRYNVAAARSRVRIPAPAVRAPAVPPNAHPNVQGLSAFFTPDSDFYRVDTALVLPQINPDDWTLRIHGMVDHPVELSFADLLRRELVEHDQTLSCVSNEVGGPYVGTARWIGAPLADLLREAGVQRGADQIVGRSIDGMTIGTPVGSVLDGRRALLAVAMNGEPLPIAHGFPVRMLVPGFFGYVSSTKWLVDLELTTFAKYDPYWVQRGWAKIAPVRTASRIDVPKPFARLSPGPATVAGVAWATHRGIDAVEVRVDGGAWQEARLAPSDSPDTWTQWTCDVDLSAGTRRLEVRATDATGAVQPETRAEPFPSGSTGWHSVVVTVS